MFPLSSAVERSQRQRKAASSDSTTKFNDSEIAVSMSIGDMRKELLSEVGDNSKYHILKSFLMDMNPDPNQGFRIFTGDAGKINEFADALNNSSYLQKIDLKAGLSPEEIIRRIREFLEAKRESVKDEVFSKFYRYVKKVVSLEYKNLKHIPKRRYYGSAVAINQFRTALLSEALGNNVRAVLEVPVDRNNGIGLSSDKTLSLKLLQSLKSILGRNNVAPYLSNIISKTYDKNRAFHEFLGFLKSQEPLQTDQNKSFLRYIIRVTEIEYRGINHPLREATVAKQSTERTLFPPGSPKVEDIKQGQIGDCYLLAALMSIIHKNPGYILNCFPERDAYAPDQETVKVRLHKVKVTITSFGKGNFAFSVSPTGTVTIELDNTILMKRNKDRSTGEYLGVSRELPFGNMTKALWVSFIEKAFSVYKNVPGVLTVEGDAKATEIFMKSWQKGPDHSLSGQNVNGGWEFMPLSIITGKESVRSSLEYVSELVTNRWVAEKEIPTLGYSAKENAVFRYIHYQLSGDNKVALTAGTRDDVVSDFDSGIDPSHAYSIQGTQITRDKKYIVLKNPHMDVVLIDPVSRLELDAGTVKLELSEFLRCFKDINESNLK